MRRIFQIVVGLLLTAVLWSGSVLATPLSSQFLQADANAAAVMAGTPYDMNNPAWLLNGKQNRTIFAYKIYSALIMLGYQAEPFQSGGPEGTALLKLFQGNSACRLPTSSLLDASCLAEIDRQLALREPVLAALAAGFALYGHMQALVPNDVSLHALAAMYSVPMSALPATLQMGFYESLQCLGGQCDGFIHDASGNTISSWPIPIDPAANNYYFVGAYFDPFVANAAMISSALTADTVLHEFGHYIDGYIPWTKDPLLPHLGVVDTAGFNNITFDLSDPANRRPTCIKRRTENPLDWLSKYGYNNYSNTAGYGCAAGYSTTVENWAEAFAMYVSAGRDFRAAATHSSYIAQEYDWLKTHVFNNVEFDTGLPQGANSGCNDVYGLQAALPGYMHCDGNYVWDFILPHGEVIGSCGSASGATYLNSPSSNLCTTGAASVVANAGSSWTWTCRGLNTATAAASCSASILTGNVADAPSGVTAVVGSTVADVSFVAPLSSGSAAIDGYTVSSNPPGGIDSQAGSTALTHTMTGLTNDMAYTFTVTAHNLFGNSLPSAASAPVTPTWSLVSENFDSLTVPALPPGWHSWVQIGSTGAWSSVNASSFPAGVAPHSGSNMALFNSHTAGTNQSARMVPPSFSLAGVSGAKLSFWMYRDNSLFNSDRLDVFAGLSPGNWNSVLGVYQENGSEIQMGSSINRFVSPVASSGWTHYVRDLPASVAGNSTVYVFFRGYSAGAGYDILLDDLVVALVPDPPAIQSVSGGNAQATVTLTPPLNNGGSAVTAYTVSPVSGTGVDINAGSNALVHTITGLSNGSSYQFTATASNAVGASNASSASNSVTPLTVPGAPGSVLATGGNKQATVSFAAPASDGGSAVTGYRVISSPPDGLDMHSDTLALNHTIVGLSNGVAYTFTVVATSAAGTSLASAASNAVAPALHASTVVLNASPNPGVLGQGINFTSTVTGVAPQGTVVLTENATPIYFQVGLNGVQAQCTVDTLGVGIHQIVAQYSGDSNNMPATSAPLTVVVDKATVSVSIGSHAPAPSYVNQNVAVTAGIAVSAPGAGYPTGTVTISDGSTSCQFDLSMSSGCNWTPDTTGQKTLVASYSGDANFNGASSAGTSHTVNALAVPGPPVISAITPVNAGAVISLQAPVMDGGSPVTGYSATCTSALDGGTPHTASGNSPLSVNGLVNGIVYVCTASASNSVGFGGDSPNVNVTPGLAAARVAVTTHTPNPSLLGAPVTVSSQVGPAVYALQLAAGGSHGCLLNSSSQVQCWGDNSAGQLGDGSMINRPAPVTVLGLGTDVTALSSGALHSCAVVSGQVWCWGDNHSGQLGIAPASALNSSTPVQVPALSNIQSIATGSNFSCALSLNGSVYCWGDRVSGTLGDGTPATGFPMPNPTPVSVNFSGVSPTGGITAIGAGYAHACAIDSAGQVFCWGANNTGQLGDNSMTPSAKPVAVAMSPQFAAATSVSAGLEHSCALSSQGAVWCWGSNASDELGDGSLLGASAVPVATVGLTSGVTALSSGFSGNCALNANGQVLCWGSGNSTSGNSSIPTAVAAPGVKYAAVASADMHSCAIAPHGSVTCWGGNVAGQLGDAGTTNHSDPQNVIGYALLTGTVTLGDGLSSCQASLPLDSCDVSLSVAGTRTLSAHYGGDPVYAPLVSANVSHTVDKITQTLNPLSFSASTLRVGGTVTANATASSGLAASFTSSTPSICTVNGSTITGVSAGSCSITASQPGDASHLAAAPVTQSIIVAATNLSNISTRGPSLTGSNVMIGGFIISGSTPKTVLIRARGPSMSAFGVPGVLVNPMLDLYSGQTVIAKNDDWASPLTVAGGNPPASQTAIQATGLAPTDSREAAILITLAPGPYTAIVTGASNSTGVAIVEVLEIDHPESPLSNISTRGPVQTGNNVMIGGFIISGSTPQTVLIRARGPSMSAFGVAGVLADPVLNLYQGQNIIASNNDWAAAADNGAAVQATGLAPTDFHESAILITLTPGPYTTIVTGSGATNGVAIVEVLAR